MSGPSICGLAAVALLLLAQGTPSEACSCAPQHPQSAFCHSQVVVRGRIVGIEKMRRENSTDEEPSFLRLQIKVSKVFKGFDLKPELEYLYTPIHESLCGYSHPSNNKSEEFLFSGHIVNDMVMISVCGFNSPISKLTPSQKRGLTHIYKTGCGCEIVPCNGPCAVTKSNQCLWTDALMSRSWVAHQALHLACTEKSNGNCVWESMKSRAGAAAPFFKASMV